MPETLRRGRRRPRGLRNIPRPREPVRHSNRYVLVNSNKQFFILYKEIKTPEVYLIRKEYANRELFIKLYTEGVITTLGGLF